ncbi:YfjI family protein [Pseudomonas sp. GCM10022186]|uniref:YfjI family protein n=1 Tax=Pseudomonas sp. GCM10022186 TaxID=3252650 RepID=UPI003616A2D5
MSGKYPFGYLPRTNAPYPQRIPGSLLRQAVDEVENNIQAPKPLILFGALTAISVATQGVFDVQKPNGQVVPVSLMLLSIADSGERKSTVENAFLNAIREFQSARDAEYQEACAKWFVDMKLWSATERRLLKRIEKQALDDSELDEVRECLLDHEKHKPKKPRQMKLIYEDVTPESLFYNLHKDFSAAGLISGEGGGILNGPAMRDIYKMNSIWGGEAIDVSRKSVESFSLEGARLTTAIMVQDAVFRKYLDRSGCISRGSGLWARFLVCRPNTTQGKRFIANGTISWVHRESFNERLRQLLLLNLDALPEREYERSVIRFSPEACERWLRVFNTIEEEISEGGRFCEMRDYASKLAENIARVAALIHVFEGEGEYVSLKVLDFAIDLCHWCSDEFYLIFVPPKPLPEEVQDAIELDKWLHRFRHKRIDWIPKNYIRKFGPNKLRQKARLDRALEELFLDDRIRFFEVDKESRIELL